MNTKKTVPILTDPDFQHGFRVHGPRHEDGYIGILSPDRSPCEPDWHIAQWACKSEILSGRKIFSADGYESRTESQIVRVDYGKEHSKILLSLAASKEYTAARKWGEDWPHLLIAQNNLAARCPAISEIQSLELTLSARILHCVSYMEHPDPSLHCAQTTLFFTVEDLAHQDMWWLGIPLFDNREIHRAEYMALDNGKEDCTGKFIYTIAQDEFTNESFHTFGKWITYRRDLLPFLYKGMKQAKEYGYVVSDAPDDYRLTSMNIGWEITGTYDAAMELSDLQLYCTQK